MEPIIAEARCNGPKFGCLLASIGVGTVTIWKSALRKSSTLSVKCRLLVISLSGSTSLVRSWPFESSAMRRASMSKLTTGMPAQANVVATGSPTYPNPVTEMRLVIKSHQQG